ncbi:MAG: periplasmic heavy metal sensor [Deltaproteobacteria bacterium]|nr:periplasmic heavy metal sensor [Deltaproteobacteria bacterium]
MRRILLWSVLTLSLAANVTVLILSVRAQVAASVPLGVPFFAAVAPDAEQRERILNLRQEFTAFRQTNLTRTEDLRGQLAELIKNDQPERARIDAVLAQIAETHAALQRRVVEHIMAVRGTLRPDQRPAYEEMMTRHLRAGIPMQGNCTSDAKPGSGR